MSDPILTALQRTWRGNLIGQASGHRGNLVREAADAADHQLHRRLTAEWYAAAINAYLDAREQS